MVVDARVELGRYEEAVASFDRVIALGREMRRPVRVLLNYSSMAFRDLYELDEARRRSEVSLSQQGRLACLHMPRLNAMVDLVQTDLLGGEVGGAEAQGGSTWGQEIGDQRIDLVRTGTGAEVGGHE